MLRNESADGSRLCDAITRQRGHALNTKAKAEYFPFPSPFLLFLPIRVKF